MTEEKHRKFDVIIGNPPYQEEAHGDQKVFTAPIYDKFMESAYNIGSIVELITPARFLFNAGGTPKTWNQKMLNDPHLKVTTYIGDSTKIFNGVEIAAGVVVTLHDFNKDFGAIKIFTAFPALNAIRQKAAPTIKVNQVSEYMFIQNKFDLDALYADHPEYKNIIGSNGSDKRFRNNIFDKIDAFTVKPTSPDNIKVLGLINNKRVWRYIDRKYVDLTHPNLFKYKVLVPESNGTGLVDNNVSTQVIGKPVIIGPNEAYTQTFIGFNAFDRQNEAENAIKYIKSKFARTMLGILKVTQHNPRTTWTQVPMQDFTDKSDINWNTSIPEIDQQLYKKYDLSQDEIDFIESHVKEMK